MTSSTKASLHVMEAKYRRSRRLNIVLGVIAAFLGVVVTAQSLPGQSPTSASAPSTSASSERSEEATGDPAFVRRDADDPMAIGDVDAPIVLTQWTDLRCPYCAVFSRDTLPTLIKEYVDTGKVRVEIHDVAFFGEQSEDAAVAARAAAKQGKFMEFVTAVYDAAPKGSHPDLPRKTLIAFARQAGVPDIDRYTADLDDPKLRAAAQESTRSAQQLGVNSVPFFVAGTTALSGAQPIGTFREFLDTALAQAE
ncbi:thioredoxin domain-containing protein [Micromonospora sp. NPDC047465]|uniref:DsbA family protein n=1 Tax=Micromonospora sp. NPDC047465 TaxID=3154813 RepID=UPI0033E66E47